MYLINLFCLKARTKFQFQESDIFKNLTVPQFEQIQCRRIVLKSKFAFEVVQIEILFSGVQHLQNFKQRSNKLYFQKFSVNQKLEFLNHEQT